MCVVGRFRQLARRIADDLSAGEPGCEEHGVSVPTHRSGDLLTDRQRPGTDWLVGATKPSSLLGVALDDKGMTDMSDTG
jgi:hypothetical protein